MANATGTRQGRKMRGPADAARVGPVALPEAIVYGFGLRALRSRTVPVASLWCRIESAPPRGILGN